MKKLQPIEWVLIILFVFTILVMVFSDNKNSFEIACEQVGGHAAWDGDQYQCLRVK